jgi:hypothetical protein
MREQELSRQEGQGVSKWRVVTETHSESALPHYGHRNAQNKASGDSRGV